MNRYYAELVDSPARGGIALYGYAFMAKSMFDAKMHAIEVSKQLNFVPLPAVWRVNKGQYAWMRKKYPLPTELCKMAGSHEAA